MKKIIVGVIAVLVLMIAGSIVVSNQQKTTSEKVTTETVSSSSESSQELSQQLSKEDKFAKLINDRIKELRADGENVVDTINNVDSDKLDSLDKSAWLSNDSGLQMLKQLADSQNVSINGMDSTIESANNYREAVFNLIAVAQSSDLQVGTTSWQNEIDTELGKVTTAENAIQTLAP